MQAEARSHGSLATVVGAIVLTLIPLLVVVGLSSVTAQAQEEHPNEPDWVRARATFGNNQKSTAWYSPGRKIWVRDLGSHGTTFFNGTTRLKYVVAPDVTARLVISVTREAYESDW